MGIYGTFSNCPSYGGALVIVVFTNIDLKLISTSELIRSSYIYVFVICLYILDKVKYFTLIAQHP